MPSVNVRKETGKLYLDFRFRNMRCREQTDLKDTPANRKRAQALLDKIQAEILLGQFDYQSTFPDSKRLRKVNDVSHIISTHQSEQVPTFKVFARLWFDELKVTWSRSYTSTINTVVFGRLIPYFDVHPINEISKEQILAFRAHLCELKKRNGSCLSPSHINRHMKILKAIFCEAAERFGFVNPFRGIKPLKVPKSDIQPFTPEEISQIIENCRDDFKEYFTVRFFTGMRTGEVDGLQWKYVDFKQRQILVRETLVGKEIGYTKTDASQRIIDMSEPVYNALCAMKLRTGNYRFVFVNREGNPLDHNAVTKRVWYPLLRHLNIPKRNPYQMRHTAATLWLASGESPEWIANQMGHSNTEMLFRVYSRYVPNLTRKDGSAANRLFSNVLSKGSDNE